MYRGNVDIFTSRRTNFNKCPYWHMDEKWTELHPNEIVAKKTPTGYLYAKEENNLETSNQILVGAFMFESTNIIISTNDSVEDLHPNDILKYDGKVYRISDIQRKKIKRQSQFSNNPGYKTYMSLKG